MDLLPAISVIIPTHNRSARLSQVLLALDRQTAPPEQYEVLVVADTCQDDTVEQVNSLERQVGFHLRLFSHSAKSASATRNLGAARARGDCLLFLDDDVIPGPGMVQAHLHARGEGRVTLGYSRPVLPEKPSFWQYNARLWWEDSFREMFKPDHRFSYRDFFSGNVSMPANLFHSVGGFDETIKVRLEDYELGLRLLKSGAKFQFSRQAIGYHYDETDQGAWLQRIYKEGIADVQIGHRHPQLRSQIFSGLLAGSGYWSWLRRAIRTAGFRKSSAGDVVARLGQSLARLLDRTRFRGPWIHLNGALREYYYWRGVAHTAGSWRQFIAWLYEAPASPGIRLDAPVVDLARFPSGEELQRCLERSADAGLRVVAGDVDLLVIPPQPDKEPLREEHIWAAAREQMEKQIAPAIVYHLARLLGGNGLPCAPFVPS